MAVKIESKTLNPGFAALAGRVIRFHRRRAGLSRRALADLAGIGKTSVFDMENGKPTVRLATLLAVLKTLNISIQLDSPLMDEWTGAGDRG